MALSTERERIIRENRPVFTTVLDLTSIPEDQDWSKVRYKGPLYFDFDADGDIELATDRFVSFLAKLESELDFDVTQARLFCSGGKGYHIEIPQECFIPKPPTAGTAWLPYVYTEVAKSLYVDTLDLKVYTGKKGRQWRTPNVKRENNCYKVPITYGEALSMTPELYAELISEQREVGDPTPPSCNSQFAMLFDRSRDKMSQLMRGKKKRQEISVKFLEPWKKAKKTPPSIEKIMQGLELAEDASFQAIAMQLAIYATSVSMALAEFLDRCKGLCEHHVSDGTRYNSPSKRRAELTRMFEYMEENTLYDFDTGPLVRLLKRGTAAPDLGVVETEDLGDTPAESQPSETDSEDGDTASSPASDVVIDFHKSVRKGFFMNADGMFKRHGDMVDSICRATIRKVESLTDVESHDFKGYEFDLVVAGRRVKRTMLGSDAFTSSIKMKQFMASNQLSYQGGEPETSALLDVMAEKAQRSGKVYVYPREGFFLLQHPENTQKELVKVFLTQDYYQCSIPEDDPRHFKLRYRPTNVTSSYNIDIHMAPDLDESMIPALHDLFAMNRPDVLADMLGWFVACHYRSFYIQAFGQFPVLHIYGEAGAGKTKSVEVLSRLHWFHKERVSIKSATSSTNFALDTDASTSTSCPMIVDEWKPKELRTIKGRYEKLKDVLKASYVGSDIGNRGTINKGAESTLGVIKSKATAPIVFLAESIETETAIFERCVVVPLTQDNHKGNKARTLAFERVYDDPTAVSALGKAIVEMGFTIDFEAFKAEFKAILRQVESNLPDLTDANRRRAAPRLVYNRAVMIHGQSIFERALAKAFGAAEFKADMEALRGSNSSRLDGSDTMTEVHSMSEISKLVSRLALMSRARDKNYEMFQDKDYIVGDGWVEIKVESSYDKYRMYCASIHDVPLFDTLDALVYALGSFSSVIDRQCVNSELREDGSTERVVRLNSNKLRRDGVQSFRS